MAENKQDTGKTADKNKNTFRVFASFEEKELFELQEMAALSPLERLQQLRLMINVAYGMHGYNPDKLPTQHHIYGIRYTRP